MANVVIGDILPYTQATATASQTVFGTNWTANVESDVVVYQTPSGTSPNDVTQILAYPAGYSVAFIGGQQQVQVTLTTPASLGDIITITRQTPADRLNLYTNTNFTPTMLNNDFGILTLVDQQAQLVDQKVGPRYNYSATIIDVVDTIIPVLGANQAWVKNSNNTAIIPISVPSGGIAPADATYLTYTAQSSTLPNSYRLLPGANVTLTPGANSLTISVTGQAINVGTINDLAYYAASGSAISPLATAVDGVLVTSSGGVPSISSILPAGLTIPGYQASITPAALTRVDDTNVTLTLGGTPSTSLLQAVSITAGWTGTLSGTRGGTGVNNGVNTATYAGNLNFAGAFTTSGAFSVTQTYTGITNVTFPTSGTLATTSQLPVAAALTKTDDTNVTLSLGGSPSTALLQATSITAGWTGTLSLARGGTAAALTASNGGIFYSTASAGAILSGTATASLPLLSGSSAAPTWGSFALSLGGALTTAGAHTLSGAFASTFTFTNTTTVTFPTSGTLATTSQIPTGSALTKTDDTNVTLTLGGSPTTALVNAASITAGWTGQLGLTRGGTNNSLTASAGGIVWSDASKLNIVSGTATANQLLLSGASATPAWSTTTYPTTNAINTIMYASSANVLGVITPANSAVMISSAGGVPSFSSTLPSGIAATNITLTTPILGTPQSGNLSNCTFTTGSWTPALTGSGAGPGAIGYAFQSGEYTKIGNVVYYFCRVIVSSLTIGGASGQLQITGLPIAVANNVAFDPLGAALIQNVAIDAGSSYVVGRAPHGQTYLNIMEGQNSSSNAVALAITNITSSSDISVTGFYFTT